jgi:arginyl-tRNA synthetase
MIVGDKYIIDDINKVLRDFSINEDIELNYSQIDSVDVQCNNLVKYSKDLRINEIINNIIEKLEKNKYIKNATVGKNNFINLVLSNIYFDENITKKLIDLNTNKKDTLIDYGGPNIGKALHVGHLRTLNIGRSIYNINKIAGNKIVSDIHLGDWGMPVASILAYIEHNKIDIKSITYGDLESIYPNANNLIKGDINFYNMAKNIAKKLNDGEVESLKNWEIIFDISVKEIKKLLEEMNHSFDFFYGESSVVKETNQVIDDAKLNDRVTLDNGALVSKEKHEPPIILIKSDGSFLYLTTDLGTVYFREKSDNYDQYLYVVDQRQANHFKQLFATVKYFELSSSSFKHVSYGTMNGADNKPLKTRDGGVYKLITLRGDIKKELMKKNTDRNSLDILTNSVLTYSDLLPNRTQNYKFDTDKFTETTGRTGIYLQYAQVRARKILNNAEKVVQVSFKDELNNDERNLILEISKFYYYFFQSLNKNEPHHLAEYGYTLSQFFNTFYSNNKILSEGISDSDRQKRIYIVQLFHQKILNVFESLGIEPVEKM